MEQQSTLIKKMKTLILWLGTIAMLTTLQSCGKWYQTPEESKQEALETINKKLQNKEDKLDDLRTEEKEVKAEIEKLKEDKAYRENQVK